MFEHIVIGLSYVIVFALGLKYDEWKHHRKEK